MPRRRVDHGGRGDEDQWRHVHHPRRPRGKDLLSVWRFPSARRGNRRRHRDGHAGALWPKHVSGSVEKFLAQHLHSDSEQAADRALRGRALAAVLSYFAEKYWLAVGVAALNVALLFWLKFAS